MGPLGVLFAAAVPNEDALARAPVAGWLLLASAIFAALIFVVQREGWRRLWLRSEDPRTMALFRIVFGTCAMCNINGLWELYGYLFTDEGLFLTDVARQVFAREQFKGFANGLGRDPYGFIDARAVWQFVQGPKYSLLFFWDSPAAFWCHWVAFQIAIISLIVGWKTRYTKWVAWFLFHSIILRNNVFWEGTENVFRTFFFYLCLSRCGHAYSVDNWLRCRALRRAGLLSERGRPGNGAGLAPCDDYPQGLQAVYRRIPAWPRLLVILQCAALYCSTGVVKNGPVWWSGDAFYYALNLDHFYRFPPQQLSAWLGTNLMRFNTHVVHFWECFFPIVVFGLLVRFGLREQLPAKTRIERIVLATAWLGLGAAALALCLWLLPVHYEPRGRTVWTVHRVRWAFGTLWVLTMLFIAWLGYRLRHRPFLVTIRRRRVLVDLPSFVRWTMGRRIWIFLGIVFHLHLMVLMNIGWFQPAALSGFICFLNGGEIAMALAMVGHWLGRLRVPGIPSAMLRGLPPLPPEDPRLPHLPHDAVRLPVAAMLVALAAAVAGVLLDVHQILGFGWTLGGIAVLLASAQAIAKLRTDPAARTVIIPRPFAPTSKLEASSAWAYGPFGRLLANSFIIYHIVAVACWLLPAKDSLAWRKAAQEPFRAWLQISQTTQSWGMFAPNPPRSNRFLRVLVTDQEGEVWDMKTDVYAAENFSLPMLGYTRQRKINRRISGSEGGKGSWYQKWHARWHCRHWALEHGGLLPRKVELRAISYSIPHPTWVAKHGAYDPVERREQRGREELLYTAHCETEIDAQLPDLIRARHGLPPSDVKVRRWGVLSRRLQSWNP